MQFCSDITNKSIYLLNSVKELNIKSLNISKTFIDNDGLTTLAYSQVKLFYYLNSYINFLCKF